VSRRVATSIAVSLAVCGITCGTDARMGERVPAPGSRAEGPRQVTLRPGMPAAERQVQNPYAGDAQSLAEGQRLYNWMNCSGCHFEGGGGIGPPLMDDDWIYGGRPDQIFDTIADGRANGMPAYGDKLAIDQIWHIVAHVHSLSDPGRGGDDR
jgi:cytochrome c oxidase cbb3-type subunit 3